MARTRTSRHSPTRCASCRARCRGSWRSTGRSACGRLARRSATFGKRIDALEARLDALIPRVAALSDEQQQAVQAIAVAELTRAQQRLAEYQTQARFALAQLVDRAHVATNAREASDAPRR
jgi:ElaB/YqjD/DUF883 family membrane-anchored ribosome-binding protein